MHRTKTICPGCLTPVPIDGFIHKCVPEANCPVCKGTEEPHDKTKCYECRRFYEGVENPPHYTNGRTIEPLNAIVDWKLDFCLGNVVKYISRAGRKEDETPLRALEKARYYLERAIKELKKQKGP